MMNTLSQGNGGSGDGGGGHYDHQNGAKTTTILTLCHCGRTTKCSKMVTLPFIDCLSLHSTPSPIIAHYDANFWLSLFPYLLLTEPFSQSVSFKIAHFAGNWFETMFFAAHYLNCLLLSVDCSHHHHHRSSIHCSPWSSFSPHCPLIELDCSRIDLIAPATATVATGASDRSSCRLLLLPLHYFFFFFSFSCLLFVFFFCCRWLICDLRHRGRILAAVLFSCLLASVGNNARMCLCDAGTRAVQSARWAHFFLTLPAVHTGCRKNSSNIFGSALNFFFVNCKDLPFCCWCCWCCCFDWSKTNWTRLFASNQSRHQKAQCLLLLLLPLPLVLSTATLYLRLAVTLHS